MSNARALQATQRLAFAAYDAYDATQGASLAEQEAARLRYDAAQRAVERLRRSRSQSARTRSTTGRTQPKKARRNTQESHGAYVFCAGCGFEHRASEFQREPSGTLRSKCRFSERLPERGAIVHWTNSPGGRCLDAVVLKHFAGGLARLEAQHEGDHGQAVPVVRESQLAARFDGWHLVGESCPGF